MNILKQSSIIMVLLVIHSRFVSAQWIEVVTGYPFYFTDATFYDELNGVIVGNESLITTHDGGNFWTKLQFDSIDFVEVILLRIVPCTLLLPYLDHLIKFLDQ